MTEFFRIEGLNDILFDQCMADEEYCIPQDQPWRGLSTVLSRDQVLGALSRLPLGVRSQALNRGMSTITGLCTIGPGATGTDAAMEANEHDLIETLVDAALFIETQGARGTQAVLRTKTDEAVENSYKTIYCGAVDELDARDILGPKIKEHELRAVRITLYCEPYWRPSAATTLGPNEIYNPGLEEDGDADGTADNWAAHNAPVLAMVSTPSLQGFFSQQVTTNAGGEGLESTVMVAPAGVTTCVAYAWIRRVPWAGSSITVVVRDTTAGADRGTAALIPTAGWPTATDADGGTWYQVWVAATGIVPAANHELWIYSAAADATVFYVDKCYWKWDATVVPDEWCDHALVYNHYDTTEGAGHEGHQNYFDAAGLKGTDEARLQIVVEAEQKADELETADLLMARRNWWDERPRLTVSENHWLEAEDAGTLTNWAAGVLARCSSGSRITNGANATGSALFQFVVDPGGAAAYRANAIKGRYDVFGMVLTDDEVNTQYRLSYSNISGTLYFYNQWVKQTDDAQWQMVYLGEANFDKFIRAGIEVDTCYIVVEYEKDAADTAELDCIWLLPKDDPAARLHTADDDWLTITTTYWVFDRTEDFDYEDKEYIPVTTYTTRGELSLQGDVMTLTPNRVDGQRLYFCCESVDATPAPDERMWEAHGAITDLRFSVAMSYMPQYHTPLE